MIWRDTRASATGDLDPERELELRLIAHAHAGAAWALSSLVARYQPPVVRYLIRLTGDQERAHALAEHVFIRMARRLRGPQRGEHLRLWLLRAATEIGLDALRRPASSTPVQIAAPARSPALLSGEVRESGMVRLLRAIGGRKRNAPRPTPPTQEFVWSEATSGQNGHTAAETLSPREQVRHRLIRAVLAELSYSEAQCLALHLVAGLNQTEVALALGMTAAVARRRIVQGLQLFSRRYEATLASLGLPRDFADADAANVQFTQAGAVIARRQVPDETGVTGEDDALRREREVTGTLVVPDRALPALEELFAAEPPGPLPGTVAASVVQEADVPVTVGPLDPLAAAAVFMSQEAPAPATAPDGASTVVTETPAAHAPPAGAAAEPVPVMAGVQSPEVGTDASGLDSVAGDVAAPVADHHAAAAELETATTAEVPREPAAKRPTPALAPEPLPARAAITARIVPVLPAAPEALSTANATRPLEAIADATPGQPDQAGSDGAASTSELAGGGESAQDDDDLDLLIEWGSNPQIPIHVRSDLNAVLTPADAPAPGDPRDESDWLLVLEDEPEGARGASQESRRRRIISADGEAEDPDESVW